MSEYRYTTEGYGPYRFEMKIDINDDPEWIAAEAAEDWHDNHDGWESKWPRKFTVLDGESNPIATFMVEREYDPSFEAIKIEEPK